jgi:hypothetical protein
MPARLLSRRSSLLLAVALAACGGPPPPDYPTLRYDYLPPIRLNVASIEVQQDFVPSGVAPDVSPLDPAQPADALRQMAADRLKPFGPAGRAVFVIENASMIQDGDTITGTFAVRLDIYTSANNRVGYAEARVSHTHSGNIDDIHRVLYDMTKQLMDDMNVQLEYQVIHSLRDWVISGTAAPTPVQQQPLITPGTLSPSAPPPLMPQSPAPGSLPPPPYSPMPAPLAAPGSLSPPTPLAPPPPPP